MTRFLDIPTKSFILFGPRGTGKSTFIKKHIKADLEIDLLKSRQFLELSGQPSRLLELTKNLKKNSWVYIDEIQKIPSLLDEVHYLIENQKLNFAISGSSARKIRRSGGNLLAGRAITKYFFPMTYKEFSSHYTIDQAIQWGSLPLTITQFDQRSDYLASYVETYLKEEIIEEGLLRKIEPFVRFLNICGVYNSQILNIENVARESFVPRSTVEKYFDLLEETLIGYRLPSLKANLNRKELTHPKFYLFDNGVARAAMNLAFEDVDSVWLGHAFEAFIINEVKAYNRYLDKRKSIYYYKYSGGYEIDLVIENQSKSISQKQLFTVIEIKNSKKWDMRWNDALIDFSSKSNGKVRQMIGVYRGQEILERNHVKIYPVEIFLNKLSSGEII